MTAVNIALEDEDWQQTWEMLKCNDLALAALVTECAESYHEQLKEIRAERLEEGRIRIIWRFWLLNELCELKQRCFSNPAAKDFCVQYDDLHGCM